MERFPQVRLFGGPALIDATGERPTTPAQRNLLALVYCHPPGTLTREQVAWLLWERGENRKTRHGIRQLIYAINSRAGVPVLERDGDAVLPCLPSDANEVEPGDGGPLALITSAPTPSYEHWLDGAKETLRRLRRRRLAEMVDRARTSMDWHRVSDLTKRLVVIENAKHVWLDLFTSSSIRAGKVATCLAFLADLRDDGVLSGDDHVSLLGRLESVRELPGPGAHEASELALVGRGTEVTWLEERIRSGTGLRFAVLGGAAGIGKTRLLEEATRIAAASGRRVGVVRLTELSGSTPLIGMDRLLSQMLTDDDMARIPEPWTGVLQSSDGKATDLEVLDPSANNRRLTQAFRIAFQELTRSKPTALLVDDLHWLDATSLDLLQNLAVDWNGG
ncbi:MAG: AAA family ATPase, partial [Longimicrobiales bacterium]